MGRRIVIDADRLVDLERMIDLGEWSAARDLVHKLANLELRDSIRAAQRRNYELYQAGRYTQQEYEENRRRLRDLTRDAL